MPIPVKKVGEILPGDIYEACNFHPCFCVKIDNVHIYGISLVDGSYPRACNILHCAVRKLTIGEALEWKLKGPSDVTLEAKWRWW